MKPDENELYELNKLNALRFLFCDRAHRQAILTPDVHKHTFATTVETEDPCAVVVGGLDRRRTPIATIATNTAK